MPSMIVAKEPTTAKRLGKNIKIPWGVDKALGENVTDRMMQKLVRRSLNKTFPWGVSWLHQEANIFMRQQMGYKVGM